MSKELKNQQFQRSKLPQMAPLAGQLSGVQKTMHAQPSQSSLIEPKAPLPQNPTPDDIPDPNSSIENPYQAKLNTANLRHVSQPVAQSPDYDNPTSSIVVNPILKNSKGISQNAAMAYGRSFPLHKNDWRAKQDRLQVYQLQKRFRFRDHTEIQKEELIHWKEKDRKGMNQTLYVKDVQKKTDLILTVTEQSRLEQNINYEDRWPLLNLRKELLQIRIYINLAAKTIIEHKAFETISILVILSNSFTLAAEDPQAEETPYEMQVIDDIFLALYSIEMVLKITGMGFIFNKGAYLRDSWNILDFVIVGSAYLTIYDTMTKTEEELNGPQEEGLSLNSLRAFRVLRPLRAITSIKGLRILVLSVLSAIPLLKETMIVLMFFFLIFAIAATQLLTGVLKQRCINSETGIMHPDEILCGGREKCEELPGYYCGKVNENPNFGVTNFDNILYALLAVFQCITLEGWSDIQKMSQMAYSDMSFLLFLPIVFLGAFFLLNLTLAVINSSFTRTHSKFQEIEQKAKEAARKNRIKRKPANGEEIDYSENTESNELGIQEFFIAKRAARKMIEFLRIQQAKRAEERMLKEQFGELDDDFLFNQDNAKKEDDEKENKRANLYASAMPGSSQPEVKKAKTLFSPRSQGKTTPREKVQTQPDITVQEPIEEASALSEEAHSEQVKKFLEELQLDINQQNDYPQIFQGDTTSKQQLPMAIMELKPNRNLMMARGSHAVLPTPTKIQTNLLMPNTGLKAESRNQNTQSNAQLSDNNSNGLSQFLDIDKVIGAEESVNDNEDDDVIQEKNKRRQEHNADKNPSEFDNSFDQYDLPEYDLPQDSDDFSQKDNNEGPAGKRLASMSALEMQSVIESDNSLNTKVQEMTDRKKEAQMKTADQKPRRGQAVELLPEKQAILKNIKKQFKRMATDNFQRSKQLKRVGVAESDNNSTLYPGNTDRQNGDDQSKTQLGFEAKSDIKPKKDISGVKESARDDVKTLVVPSVISGKTSTQNQRRKNFEEVVENIDDVFTKANAKEKLQFNMNDCLDKKTQKIEINSGVAYKSSSHDDVFEIRNRQADAQAMSLANNYIKSAPLQDEDQQDEGDADDEFQDHEYIISPYEAYQLKNCYQTTSQEQVEFDSDDEDALILALQPFDTVMSLGFGHLLTHIPTKFRARRSDIIVSSTLSITLSPSGGDYKCKDLALMTQEEIIEWCNKRCVFRSIGIKTVDFDYDEPEQENYYQEDYQQFAFDQPISENQKSQRSGQQIVTEEQEFASGAKTGRSVEPFLENQVYADHKQAEILSKKSMDMRASELKLADVLNRQKIIPACLLCEPLPANKINLLSDEEKKMYNIQKVKYESAQRQVKKMPFHPLLRRYDLKEAIQLYEGKFHDEEQEAENFENVGEKSGQNATTMYYSKAEAFNEQPQFEMFESAFKKVLSRPRFDFTKIKGDSIPKYLREELDLPDDLEGNEINYDEVKRKDANVKRRRPLWSGQEVLEIGLIPDQANWVINKLNAVRVWPYGKFGILKRLRVQLKKFVKHTIFDNSMTFCVLLNTITMSMQRYGQSAEEIALLDYINEWFTWIFIFEMSSKLLAIGIQKYLADKMNWLDGGVVMLSIVEIVLVGVVGQEGGGLSAFKTIRVFRTFRVLRVARLLRALHSMQVIIAVIQRSAGSFLYITMLLFVFIFIFTLLGMQIFGGQFNFPDGKPRGNYDTFNIALVTVFQVLTMENWQTVLYDSMRSDEIGLIIPAVFYIVWIFLGNFILLNLFLAILLDSFLSEDDEDEEDILEAEKQAKIIRQQKIEKEKERRLKKLGTTTMHQTQMGSMMRSGTQVHPSLSALAPNTKRSMFDKRKPEELLVDDIDDLEENAIREIFMDEGIIKKKDAAREKARLYAGIECEFSLYLFKKQGCVRLMFYKLQKNKIFDNFIMFLIGVSSLKLAADTYFNKWDEDDPVRVFSDRFDIFLNLAFLFECITKVIALGFLMDNGSYLRETWNQLDLFIVITSMMDMALSGVDLPVIKILRLLRTLRPLRVISHNVAMKLIVASLFESVGAIFNVVIVVVSVWLMFAIFAINIFSGKFFYCTVGVYQNADKYQCNVAGGSWVVHDSNFDDVFQAMMTLFIVASLEGWPDIMLASVDATYVDEGPKPEFAPINAYFFMVFILIGSFFLLNFFIGVLFLKYAQAQKNETKGYTTAHLTWIDIQKMIIDSECPHDISNMPESVYRKKIWRIVNSNSFDVFIMATIMLNIVQMALSFQGEPAWYTGILNTVNYGFSAIFLAEAILKLMAYGWSYFGTTWNKFDFFVVVSSLLDILMDQADSEDMEAMAAAPQLAKILRVLRVTRVLRLAGKNEGLQALMQTITMSIGSLANVFLLLVLVLFIFSILGVFFFQDLNSGDIIDGYKNFNNFGQSFLLLFAISTGEDWNKLMYDCVDTPPMCIPNYTCGSSLAPAYYIIFVMIVSNVMLNLFILVIIQQFELYYVSTDNPISKFKHNQELFMKTWIDFTAKKYKCVKIREKQLNYFFKKLPPPIGMTDDTSDAELKKTMLKMGIRCDDGYIYFNELLYRCMRRQYGNFKLNKRMQIVELKTQYKIYLITLRHKNMARQMQNQELFFEKMVGNDKAVNPFVQKMYYRISFNTWRNVMIKQERRDQHEIEMKEAKEKAQALGMPFIEKELLEDPTQFVHVTIEVEKEELFTSEEESEDKDDGKKPSWFEPKSATSRRSSIAKSRNNLGVQKSNSNKKSSNAAWYQPGSPMRGKERPGMQGGMIELKKIRVDEENGAFESSPVKRTDQVQKSRDESPGVKSNPDLKGKN